MSFTNRDIADYYNQTLNHYQKWWKLDKVLAVHYGYWDSDTKTFAQSLENTNKVLMRFTDVKENARILDAGCGVGGSAFYLASKGAAHVSGVTLSEKQLDFANLQRKKLGLSEQVDFKLEDYTKTSFEDNTFDLVWAVESVTSAPDKQKFAKEIFRVLKPGGKLIVADYYLPDQAKPDPNDYLKNWQDCWSLAPFLSVNNFSNIFRGEGLNLTKNEDISSKVHPSAKIMYRAYLMGAIPSIIYNTFHKTSRFAKTHYKSGLYQYKALKQGLWEYRILLFEKANI